MCFRFPHAPSRPMLVGMRVTLKIDDDVAVLLQRARQGGRRSLKEVANEALRLGLRAMEARPEKERFHVKPLKLGPCLIGSLDNVAEALAIAEGEDYR